MSIAIQSTLLTIELLFLLPTVLLAFEVLATVLFGRGEKKTGSEPDGPLPTLAVLIPAHDESFGLAPTIADVQDQLPAIGRLLVVADNCQDDTAEIARAAGAEVVERWDPDRRGKGYAVDYGIRHLSNTPPEVVIVLDADCRLGEGSLGRIARLAMSSGRPVQSLYEMKSPPDALIDQPRISEFAWRVRTLVRPLGVSRLGLPCQLAGSGMALPWAALTKVELATDNLVEDLKLGLDLAALGYPPVFCPTARVTSVFPKSAHAALSQRQRWEGGAIRLIGTTGLRTIWAALRRRNYYLLFLAIDMTIPPLVLLCALWSALLLLGSATAAFGLGTAPLLLASLAMAVLASSLALAYRYCGTDLLSPQQVLSLLQYAWSKFRIHRRPALTWVRTDRL